MTTRVRPPGLRQSPSSIGPAGKGHHRSWRCGAEAEARRGGAFNTGKEAALRARPAIQHGLHRCRARHLLVRGHRPRKGLQQVRRQRGQQDLQDAGEGRPAVHHDDAARGGHHLLGQHLRRGRTRGGNNPLSHVGMVLQVQKDGTITYIHEHIPRGSSPST